MKRVNLVLNEDLLRETLRISGEKTYSGAVEYAMRDLVRYHAAKGMLELQGKGLWTGNLSEMRDDKPRRRTRR